MKIVFIGTVDFSYHCLVEILENKGQVEGIVTSSNNKINNDFKDLTPISKNYNIPILYTDDVNEARTIEWIKKKNPDIIFCFGWSRLIKEELLNLTELGVLGAHPALLPKNRGRHPIIWALVLGLKNSGLTFFFMDKGADSGPILSQRSFDIDDNDDSMSIYNKIKELASLQIKDFLPKLLKRNFRLTEQDHSKANYLRKRSRKDGLIDWRMSTSAIINLVRALYKPYPGAEINIDNDNYIVWKIDKYLNDIPKNIEPGKVILIEDDCPVVKTFDGAVKIIETEPLLELCKGIYL